MTLSFSNLAWDHDDDPWVAEFLRAHQVSSIDLTPAKYFQPLAPIAESYARAVGDWWKKRGIDIVGMQALFHGTRNLNMFGDEATRQATLAHLEAMCRLGAILGATRLTFGAPRNRDRGALSPAVAAAQAVDFFQRLGKIAAAYQVVICLEPVPESHGANFMTDTASAAEIVRRVDHAAVRLQLDIGTATANGEDLAIVMAQTAPQVGHIHISEPQLAPLGTGSANHEYAGKLLSEFLPERVLSIEMLTPAATRRQDMERALQVARRHYLA